jgi:hypothetical protein
VTKYQQYSLDVALLPLLHIFDPVQNWWGKRQQWECSQQPALPLFFFWKGMSHNPNSLNTLQKPAQRAQTHMDCLPNN